MLEPTEPWQRLAEPHGGTVPGLWADASTGCVLAATWAGIHRSCDAGATWQPTASGASVPFAESVVALGSTYLAAAADGLYRSTDAGQSWQRALVGGRCLSLAAHAGVVLAGTECDGVLRSEDAGQTWAGANTGLRDPAVLSLALSPSFDSDGLGFAGTASGLYRTRSGGRAWREVDLGLPGEPAVECVACGRGPDGARLVLVGTATHGLVWSNDGGNRWSTADGLADRSVAAIAVDANGRIAAATDAGVAIADDLGLEWRMTGAELGPALSLAFAGSVLLAGLPRDGIARSPDHGLGWSIASTGLAASVVLGLVALPGDTDRARLFSVGLQEGVLASADGGRTWTPHNAGLEGVTTVGLAAVAGGALCVATSSGVFRSADAGCTWQRVTQPEEHITAIAASRATPRVVAGTEAGKIVRSDDGGQTWHELDSLPGNEPGQIAAVEVAADGTVLVGTRTGSGWVSVWRLAEPARRWERILREPAESAPRLAIGAGGEVLVGLSSRVLRPRRHAYERREGERRPVWHATPVGPADALITSIATHPATPTLFVATSAGVFVSQPSGGGEAFEPWSDGLWPRAVVALAMAPDGELFGVGLGGSIWRRR